VANKRKHLAVGRLVHWPFMGRL